MLVSSIARFNAPNTMNKAQASANLIDSVSNAHTFGGEHDTAVIYEFEKEHSFNNLTNRILYNLSYLQEKIAAKAQKNKLNVLA